MITVPAFMLGLILGLTMGYEDGRMEAAEDYCKRYSKWDRQYCIRTIR